MVLLTGADGFIGSHLRKALEAEDYEVIALGNDCDLRDQNFVREAVCRTRPDIIIHLAANVGVDIWDQDDGSLLLSNALIDCNLAAAIRSLDYIPRVIYASSSELYQDEYQYEDAEIKLPLNYRSRSGYAFEKALGEKLFDDINLRLFNIVGPGQDKAFALPKMISAAINNRYITTSNDIRSFCSIYDACSWIVAMCNDLDDVDPGVYNIGNPDNAVPMIKVAKKIRKYCNSRSNIVVIPDGYCMVRKPDITKASRFYKPKISLKKILKDLLCSDINDTLK